MSSSATIAAVQYALLLFTFTYFLYKFFFHQNQRTKPPGPVALPIIGNLHMLGSLPHRNLHSLSKKYGPIMSLKLGQVPAIVVSSSEAAEIFLKTHDIVFASRPKLQASEILSYGAKGFAFSQYGPYWRNMRKLCTVKLLSMSRVEQFAPIRKEELGRLVKSLEKAAAMGEVVNVSKVVQNLIEDIVYRMILGRNKYQEYDLKALVDEELKLIGAFNLADNVPWLEAFDFQGLRRGCKKANKAFDEVMEKIITEHEQDAKLDKTKPEDFIDILLYTMHQTIDVDSEQNHIIDRTNIKAILLDIIVASIDTSATTIEWALSELFRHPRVMKILQDEIEKEVGNSRMVEEADLMKLSYLDMVVDETLRLYPVAPLLLPRESRENITIDGYFIKKKTRVIINAWAIGRDPKVWSENVEAFYPERFADNKINYQGQHFESIPFGSGRRRCPGIQLGLVTVRLVLAQLVHCFNWELPFNVTPANLNMQEKFGLTIPRAENLHGIPNYRLASNGKHELSKEGNKMIVYNNYS